MLEFRNKMFKIKPLKCFGIVLNDFVKKQRRLCTLSYPAPPTPSVSQQVDSILVFFPNPVIAKWPLSRMNKLSIFRLSVIAATKMVKTALFGRFAAFVLAFFLVQEGDGACLSTRGIGFKERSNAYLNATAFAVTEVQFSLHCLLACENDARCNSLNIIQTNKLICELHSGDSTTTEVSTSSTSSLYEIIPSSEV